MKVNLKNKTSQSITVSLLLSFLACFPVSAASYGEKDGNADKLDFNIFGSEEEVRKEFDFNKDFSYIEHQESTQKKSKEQVSYNYQRVVELIKQQEFKEASVKLTALIQKDPGQSSYYNLKALLKLIDKDLPEAEQSFLKAIELNPGNVQAYRGLAKLALDNRQFEKAKFNAIKAVEIYPYSIDSYKILAAVALQQQGIDAAENVLLDAQLKVKDNLNAELEIVNLLGKVYARKKQPEKILHLATDLAERNQGNLSALSYLAGAQLANKDETGAEQTLRQIIDQHPKDTKHKLLLARLLDKQKGKESEILNLLDEAALIADNPALILTFKAAVLIKQKQFQKALSTAQHVEESNPKSSLGKILKGDVYSAEKKYKEALQSYQQAYQITPIAKLLDSQLKMLTLLNRHQNVIDLLEKELAKNKDNTGIQSRLAVAYQKSGQNNLAIKYYELLMAKQQDNVMVLNNLAWVYNEQKEHSKALKLAEQAYKKAPKSAVIADTYGYILLKNGDKQESLRILKQAVELDAKLVDAQLHLAESYIANGYKQQAKNILRQLLKKEGNNNVAARKMMDTL